MTADSVKSLSVFVASPGGVDAERNVVEHVASILNMGIAAKARVVVVVHRWERVIGAAGSPQSQLNAIVDDCDIFIGLVHRWWGSDTGNGFDSGFGEEFDRALARWKSSGTPRVALFFKKVDPIDLKDPGEQLRKVISFRGSIEKEHTTFFTEFVSTEQFELGVFQLLSEEVFRIATLVGGEGGESAAAGSAPVLSRKSTPISEELEGVLQQFTNLVGGRDVSTIVDIDRLELFSLALSKDNDMIPTRLANRLLLRRTQMSLSIPEIRGWFRAYVIDLGKSSQPSERVIPFASILVGTGQTMKNLLEDSAESFLGSGNAYLVSGWLRLAGVIKVRPSFLWSTGRFEEDRKSQLVSVWSGFISGSVLELAVEYWLRVRRPRDISLARVLSAAESPLLVRFASTMAGLLKTKPDASGLCELMYDMLIHPAVAEVFGELDPFASLSIPDLEALALRTYVPSEVRLRALDEILRRDDVPTPVIVAALQGGHFDSLSGDWWVEASKQRLFDREVSGKFVTTLLESTVDLDSNQKSETRRAIARLARRNTALQDAAQSFIDGNGNFDADCAALLFARFEGTLEVLDVAESVISGRNERANAYLALLSQSGGDESTVSFVRASMEIHALRYISRCSDARIRRRYASRIREVAKGDGVFQFEATRILIDCHEDEDVDFLVDRLRYMNAEVASHAVRTIVGRSSLRRLLLLENSENETIAVAAFTELIKRGRAPSRAKIKQKLRSKSSKVRLAALEILLDRSPTDSVNVLLDEYVEGRGTHYYNVVCEMDRVLGGIAPIYSTNL